MESTLRSSFLLRPDITFLNFGSFGACPQPVFEDYQHWQRELEAEPVQFITVQGPKLLAASRAALAGYIGCDPDDVVYTTNPTYAVNIIARSLRFGAGDEVLTTDLEYGAMDRTWNFYAKEYGFRYVRQPIALPVTSKEEIVEAFFRGRTPNTRAIFISHLTSTTALRLPVEEICARAKAEGLITIVDGAHAPGHVALDLRSLQADFYTGACHKWMMAPKGNSFLYTARALQDKLDPIIVSWGYDSAMPSHSRYLDYHEMQGTRDFSAFLATPACLRFMEENNWPAVAAECRGLVRTYAPRLAELLGTPLLAPLTDDFFGQMCSLPIQTPDPLALKRALYDVHRIEIPVMVHGKAVYLRYSIQAFNSSADLDRLEEVLTQLLAEGKLLQHSA